MTSLGSAWGTPPETHGGSFSERREDSGVELEDLAGRLERFTSERVWRSRRAD